MLKSSFSFRFCCFIFIFWSWSFMGLWWQWSKKCLIYDPRLNSKISEGILNFEIVFALPLTLDLRWLCLDVCVGGHKAKSSMDPTKIRIYVVVNFVSFLEDFVTLRLAFALQLAVALVILEELIASPTFINTDIGLIVGWPLKVKRLTHTQTCLQMALSSNATSNTHRLWHTHPHTSGKNVAK